MNACNNDITVDFIANGSSTIIKFEHFHFNKHGEGADEYLKAMDSKQGWGPYPGPLQNVLREK